VKLEWALHPPFFYAQRTMSRSVLAIWTILLLACSSCSAGEVYGHSQAQWLTSLSSGQMLDIPPNADPVLILRLGPGSILFTALHLQEHGKTEQARRFIEAATHHETGIFRQKAVDRLMDQLLAEHDYKGLLHLVRSNSGASATPWHRALHEARALSALGLHQEAHGTWSVLASAFASESAAFRQHVTVESFRAALNSHDATVHLDASRQDASSPTTASQGEASPSAGLISGNQAGLAVPTFIAEFRRLLYGPAFASWHGAMRSILTILESFPIAAAMIDPFEQELSRIRVLTGERDFGRAVVGWRRLGLWHVASGRHQANNQAQENNKLTESNQFQELSQSATQSASQSASQSATPQGSRFSADFPAPPWLNASIGAQFITSLDRASLGDLARAFLAASPAEGQAIFELLATQHIHDQPAHRESNYLYLFWSGRFARAAEQWMKAAELFGSATLYAEPGIDLDAACWYEADCRSRYAPLEAVAVLAKALETSPDPAYFSDLIEPLSRRALARRDKPLLVAIIAAAGHKASPKDQARLAYITARAVEIGMIPAETNTGSSPMDHPDSTGGTTSAYIRDNLERAWQQYADPWYRLLAAHRLGQPLMEVADGPGAPEPPPLAIADVPDAAVVQLAPVAPATDAVSIYPKAADQAAYAQAMVRFGLAHMVRSDMGTAYRDLPAATIRSVAEALEKAGDHAAAIRAIAALFSRTGYIPTRRDRELYWPRAFSTEIDAAAAQFNLPPALLYGLVRSESLFQATVVSRAGAIGLAQLMPATAAETATRLRMATYDLNNPADNLTLGAAYFRRVLDNQRGRFMPTIFSYNAGPTRFRRWEADFGPLPMDLLLETLEYAETRQYGRNVIGAAMAYEDLYGDQDLQTFMATLLDE
jgi:soluble lytic murein transglycosylase-like protein